MASWQDVALVVATLPETSEPSPRSWRVRKKPIVWELPLRKADHEALGTEAPDGDPAVPVRLAEIDVAELAELVTEAWLAQAPKTLAKAFLANRLS